MTGVGCVPEESSNSLSKTNGRWRGFDCDHKHVGVSALSVMKETAGREENQAEVKVSSRGP